MTVCAARSIDVTAQSRCSVTSGSSHRAGSPSVSSSASRAEK
ncbi:Uncharacterised protein [Mycobacteroides abscessus]|nr:Uncharacterised protein [Mycobacteroides abscessus]